MLMIRYAFRFRVQREIYARSAGPGLHPGAAEYSSLFKYYGLSIRLLRARQPDAACHVDYQPGPEISYSSSRTQVNHVSGYFWTFLNAQPSRPITFVLDHFCKNLPGRWNKTEERIYTEVKELVSNSSVKSVLWFYHGPRCLFFLTILYANQQSCFDILSGNFWVTERYTSRRS